MLSGISCDACLGGKLGTRLDVVGFIMYEGDATVSPILADVGNLSFRIDRSSILSMLTENLSPSSDEKDGLLEEFDRAYSRGGNLGAFGLMAGDDGVPGVGSGNCWE